MAKVVKLKVHKNKLMKKEGANFKDAAFNNFKNAINKIEPVGYCLLAWDKEGAWMAGHSVKDESPIPYYSMPEFAKYCLTRQIMKD